MSSSKDIENAILRANCEASEAMRQRVWEDTAKQRHSSPPAAGRTGTWKIAAAAVLTTGAAASLLFVFAPLHGVSNVYGMTDLPALLEKARTLHVQSTEWQYPADPNHTDFEQALVIPRELWVDVPNLREHFISHMAWSTPEGEKGMNRMEGVRDRQYAMDINHTEKTVTFHKVSIVQRRVAVRDQIRRSLNRIAEGQIEHFVRVGQESIKGILYNIWEQEDADIHNANARQRVRCWLAPTTGELGRIYIWRKTGDERWRLTWCADTIERDVDIPDSVFAFTAPEDYRHKNTLATAYAEGLGRGLYFMGRARVAEAINFTLDDGSIVLGWHSDDLDFDRYQEQGHLFKDLVPGGELPKLPMVVYGLKTTRMETHSPPEVTYEGRHLAFTKKDRWYYEWALYVCRQPWPASAGRPLYHMLCRFNLPNGQPPQVGNPVSDDRISPDEFDLFVREAMAELSDDGKAPPHVTYENVIRWAKEIRASLME